MMLLTRAGISAWACVMLGVVPGRTEAAGAAWAQPGAADGAGAGVLVERPLQEALDESVARSRLLVVVTSPTREKEQASREMWSQAALREWARWHAVVVHVRDRGTLEVLRQAGMVTGLPEQPLVFKAGMLTRVFGSNVREDNGAPAGVRLRPAPAAKGARADRPDPAVRLMWRLEWTRAGLAKADPAWGEAHARSNPEPDPPKVAYLFSGVSDRADAALGDGAGVSRPEPVSRWLRLVDQGAGGAGGAGEGGAGAAPSRVEMWSWLWERGCEHEPAFAGALLSTVARRWHAEATTEGGSASAARARAIRRAASGLLPWMGAEGWIEWLMISRIADEHVETLDFLDAALDDPDARVMMPAGTRLMLEAMLPWANWALPRGVPGGEGEPLVPLRGLRDRLEPRRLHRLEAGERARVEEFVRWMVGVQGSRLHADFLAAGDVERAASAGEIVGAVLGPGEGSIWLATAAVSAGQARAEHAEALEAEGSARARRLAAIVRERAGKRGGE